MLRYMRSPDDLPVSHDQSIHATLKRRFRRCAGPEGRALVTRAYEGTSRPSAW